MSTVSTTTTPAAVETMRFLYAGKPMAVPAEFVTKLHPGGKAVLLPYVDRDIMEAFTEAAHSFDAQEMIEEFIAASDKTVAAAERKVFEERKAKREAEEDKWRWRSTAIAFSIAGIVAAFVLRPAKH